MIRRKRTPLTRTIERASQLPRQPLGRYATGRAINLTGGWYVSSATASELRITNDSITTIVVATYNGVAGTISGGNTAIFANPDYNECVIFALADDVVYELFTTELNQLVSSQSQATIDSINADFEMFQFRSKMSIQKDGNSGRLADRIAMADTTTFFNVWGQHNQDWAIEFWARTNRNGGTSNAGIVRFGTPSNDNYWTISDGQSTDQLLFRFYTDNAGASATSLRGQFSLYSPSTVDAGSIDKYIPNDETWHHIIIRYWGATQTDYAGTERLSGDMRLFTVWIDGVRCEPPSETTGYGNGINILTNGTAALVNGWNDTPTQQPVDFLSGYNLSSDAGQIYGLQNLILWRGKLSNTVANNRYVDTTADPLGVSTVITKAILPFNGYENEVTGGFPSAQPILFNADNTLSFVSSTETESP